MDMEVAQYCKSLESVFSGVDFPHMLGGGWLNLVTLALLGSTFLMIVLYMVANLFKIPKLEAWTRVELFQIGLTALFAVMLAWSVQGMCNWDVTFMDPGQYGGIKGPAIMAECGYPDATIVSAFCVSTQYLEKVKRRGNYVFEALIYLNYLVSYLFKMRWESKPMGIGYTLDPLAGFQQLQNVFLVSISGFTISYLSLLIQIRMLDFFLIAMPYFFLPIGLLMRSFAPTREFGGAVMGFAITSLFFFPLIIVTNDIIVYTAFDEITKVAEEQHNRGIYQGIKIKPQETNKNFNPLIGMYESNPESNGKPVEKADSPNPEKISKFFTTPDPNTAGMTMSKDSKKLGTYIWPVTSWVMIYVVASVILPILNFMVYVEIARGLSGLFWNRDGFNKFNKDDLMSTGMGFNDVGTSGFPVDISGGFDSGAFSEWGPITIVLGMLTFSIVTVLYMFAISFNLKSLKMWAKSEFMQIIITFLLVIFMFAVIDIVWDVMVDIVTNLYTTDSMLYKPQGGWPVGIRLDPFSFSQMFIKNTMIDCEINVYRVLYAVNFFYDFFGKMSTEILGSDPVGGWYTTVYSSIFKYINGHINMLLLFHWIQIRFLSLIKFTMPIVILLGLMLRIFPMSRGSGGLLIAVGFGFFAVYPISIALLMTMQPPATSFCTEFGPPALLDISNQNTVVMSAADVAHTRNAIEAEESEVKILIDKLKNFIPLFYLQALFLPIVSLIITFTFIRQTGALFGADLAEVGRGMIKLI